MGIINASLVELKASKSTVTIEWHLINENCSDPVHLGKNVCKRGLISAPKLLLLMNVTKLMGRLYDSVLK